MTTTPDSVSEVDRILAARFHGAVNIRGIRYQILYSLVAALRLYELDSAAASVRLEGIEDVDLIGFQDGDHYVQVKTADSPWNWAKLKGPVEGFLEFMRADLSCLFSLTVNFKLTGDIGRLAEFNSLTASEQKRIRKKFRKLCREIGGTSDEADDLLKKLEIKCIPEQRVWDELRRQVTDHFKLGSAAVNTYLSVLFARFLEWAASRSSVTKAELDGVRQEVGETLSRETAFQAYGEGLITEVDWSIDEKIDDFFDGKSTRPGHIAAGAEVNRPHWIARIEKSLAATKVCILRSSSGQGKSTLLYRYAHERWAAKQTLVLRIAETPKEVELIRNYLAFRSRLGVPLLLLIDNAAVHTKLWPLVVQQCAALGVHVLVSVRTEDWYRFAQNVTSFEVLEPELDLEEARQIFRQIKNQGRLHPSIDSPEWAFERIGEPHLLMEYVYLLTHGRMLEDRLRDQIKEFTNLSEDPAKTEVLRRSTLADSLGASVNIEELLKGIPLRGDPQSVLNSLDGEYIQLQGEQITGLHWVRSDHIARILHEGFPSRAVTIINVLDAIPKESLPSFIANAICCEGDRYALIDRLSEKAKTASFDEVLSYADGVFEAGERLYFQENRALFDEAYELLGTAGVSLLLPQLLPIVKADILTSMANTLKDKGENFKALEEIASRESAAPRGLDLVKKFLAGAVDGIKSDQLAIPSDELGRLLDWCALTETTVVTWSAARALCLNGDYAFSLPINSFSTFAQGIFRYDTPGYNEWYNEHELQMLAYLAFHTDSLSVRVEDGSVFIECFIDDDSLSPNDQVMQRLRTLRSALPFCDRYCSDGVWNTPLGFEPSVNDTEKRIPRENLHYESDIEKNVVLRECVESAYRSDSYYRFEQDWHEMRTTALKFVSAFSRGLEKTLTGKAFDFQVAFENGELPVRLDKMIANLPDPPPQTAPKLIDAFKAEPSRWAVSFQSFIRLAFECLKEPTIKERWRYPIINLKETAKLLPQMHAVFRQLFERVPDHFDLSKLPADENQAYLDFADLFEAWVKDPSQRKGKNPLRQIRAQAKHRRREHIDEIRRSLADLEEEGITVTLPEETYLDSLLTYLPIAFSVEDPLHVEVSLELVLDALCTIGESVDLFWLIPVHDKRRFMDGGYQISTRQLSNWEKHREMNWEALCTQEIPQHLQAMMPPYPVQTIPRVEFRSTALGLIVAIDLLGQRYDRVAVLESSSEQFLQMLFDRHREKLKSMEEELSKLIQQLIRELDRLVPQPDDNLEYATVREFLETAGSILGNDGFVRLRSYAESEVEVYGNAVESLASKSEISK